jgi:hypothetical protein
MRNSEPESGLNFNLIMPVALLLVLLVVPFSINSFMHFMSGKRQFNPVIMKLPVDSTAITIPSSVKQYESFDVVLNLETKQLAKFLNEIVATASAGTSIQGITGMVSSHMKAEITGEDFGIDRMGPQDPVSDYGGTANWRWRVMPESSGEQILKLQLHISTQNNTQANTKILDLAEASLSVQANPMEWTKRNGLWLAILLLLPIVAILRRYAR